MRTFVLLALPGMYLSSLHSALDVLRIGDRHVRERMRNRQSGGRLPPAWISHVLSPDDTPIDNASGTRVSTDGEINNSADEADAVFIPALDWSRPATLETGLRALQVLSPWLEAAHARGALIAAHHMGVCAVAEAGLLTGANAAVPMQQEAWFRRRYPRIRCDQSGSLVLSRGIITAAALDQGPQLACQLVDRFGGGIISAKVRQEVLQMAGHSMPPPTQWPAATDPLIQRAQSWLTNRLTQRLDIQSLASHLNLSERSLFRRFRQALGVTPLQYLQALRLETARATLERTTWSVEAVAHHVGYDDAAFLGRLFQRRFGQTPGVYRRQLRAHKESTE